MRLYRAGGKPGLVVRSERSLAQLFAVGGGPNFPRDVELSAAAVGVEFEAALAGGVAGPGEEGPGVVADDVAAEPEDAGDGEEEGGGERGDHGESPAHRAGLSDQTLKGQPLWFRRRGE